jgi:hypothetical protein
VPRATVPGKRMRNPMVKHGDIASSPDGKLWCVIGVDDERVVLRMCDHEGVLICIQRGGQRIEISWKEWATGWEISVNRNVSIEARRSSL